METINVIIGVCILIVAYLLVLYYVFEHSPIIEDKDDPEFHKINITLKQNQTLLNNDLL